MYLNMNGEGTLSASLPEQEKNNVKLNSSKYIKITEHETLTFNQFS